jgi:hypothetical protein
VEPGKLPSLKLVSISSTWFNPWVVWKSSSISWVLGQAQHAVQGILANITHDVIQAGISTGKGLASLNQDGIFLSEIPVVDRQTVQKEYERMLKLKTLVKVWREQVSQHLHVLSSINLSEF